MFATGIKTSMVQTPTSNVTTFSNASKFVKIPALRVVFSSCLFSLGVWKCGQTRSFVFDILHTSITMKQINDLNIACSFNHADYLELIHLKRK